MDHRQHVILCTARMCRYILILDISTHYTVCPESLQSKVKYFIYFLLLFHNVLSVRSPHIRRQDVCLQTKHFPLNSSHTTTHFNDGDTMKFFLGARTTQMLVIKLPFDKFPFALCVTRFIPEIRNDEYLILAHESTHYAATTHHDATCL